MQTSTIKALLADCKAAAIKAGCFDLNSEESTASTWVPTAADLEWITTKLGYKPSRKAWEDAGLKGVGAAHISQTGTSGC